LGPAQILVRRHPQPLLYLLHSNTLPSGSQALPGAGKTKGTRSNACMRAGGAADQPNATQLDIHLCTRYVHPMHAWAASATSAIPASILHTRNRAVPSQWIDVPNSKTVEELNQIGKARQCRLHLWVTSTPAQSLIPHLQLLLVALQFEARLDHVRLGSLQRPLLVRKLHRQVLHLLCRL
jgi:hypothetical protein